MFTKAHQLDRSYNDRAYLEEFMDAYGISYTSEDILDKIRFTVEMTKREFNAFCEYLNDLHLMGVDPILL